MALLLAALVIAYAVLVKAVVVQYPLQSQVPQIAFVNQPFEWTFSPLAFLPNDNTSTLSYQASALPSWVTFDPSTTTFAGTPTDSSIGRYTIYVSATEPGVGSASSSFCLMVCPGGPPIESIPLAAQFTPDNPHIASAHVLVTSDGGPGVRVRQAWSFSIGLQPSTFTAPDGGSIYYAATLSNGDPLPSWLIFDDDEMTFDGVTPRVQDSNSTAWEITLHASEVQGFSAARDTFVLVLDSSPSSNVNYLSQPPHSLSLVAPLLPINVTSNEDFSFDFDFFNFQGVVLDGETITRQNISDIIVDTADFPWLSFDNKTSRLSGTPPQDLTNGSPITVPVDIVSKYDNLSVATNVSVLVYPPIFTTSTLLPVVALPGSRFSYEIDQYLVNTTGYNPWEIEVWTKYDPRDAATWLNFSSNTHILQGTVPQELNYTSMSITFYADNPQTNATSTTSLSVNVAAQQTSDPRDSSDSKHNRKIIGAVVGTVVGLLLICLIFAGCRWWSMRLERIEKGSTFTIDHGLHGDRFAAGVAAAVAGARSVSDNGWEKVGESGTSPLMGHQGQESFDPVRTLEVRDAPHGSNSRPLSTSSGSGSSHIIEAKIPKAAFFKKQLKKLSERSLHRIQEESEYSKHGKDASHPGVSRSASNEGSSGVSGLISKLTGSTSGARLVISRPIVQEEASTPPLGRPSVTFENLVEASEKQLPPPPLVEPPVVMHNLVDNRSNLSIPNQNILGLDLSGSSSSIIDGPVDRASSLSEEPDFVWASTRVLKGDMSQKAYDTFTTDTKSKRASERSSLDSVIPKRRPDFRTSRYGAKDAAGEHRLPPTLEGDVSSDAVTHSQINMHLASVAENRVSSTSFNSVDAVISHADSTAVISTVTGRRHVVGTATPSVHSVNRFSGASDVSRVSQPIAGAAPTSPTSVGATSPGKAHLVDFEQAHTIQPNSGYVSISHQAVISSDTLDHAAAPKVVVSGSEGETSWDLDERLESSIDYVRAFGMDFDGAGSSTSPGKQLVVDVGKANGYYMHKNGHINAGSPETATPSILSSVPSSQSMNSANSHPDPPGTGELTPLTPMSASSGKVSTHRIYVAAGRPFNFAIPLTTNPDLNGPALVAVQQGGHALPGWLNFDDKVNEFWGLAPEELSSSDAVLGVSVWQGSDPLSTFVVEVA